MHHAPYSVEGCPHLPSGSRMPAPGHPLAMARAMARLGTLVAILHLCPWRMRGLQMPVFP